MLIKYSHLAGHLRQPWPALFFVLGAEPYLLNEAANTIKRCWRAQQTDEVEVTCHALQSASDWLNVLEEANSYSLFATHHCIEAHYPKKSLDKQAKETLEAYLKRPNPHCLLLIRAPEIPVKHIPWLTNHPLAAVIQVFPLTESALTQWIAQQLHQQSLPHAPEVPLLIQRYNQGNLFACAQTIEKLALTYLPSPPRLTVALVEEHVSDQCEYSVFSLTEACLRGNVEKTLHLLRHAKHNKTEPTLILWLLANELRQLAQLSHLLRHALGLSAACTQLKIWPQRSALYQTAVKRIPETTLYTLLQTCKQTDERIKTTQDKQIWLTLEQIAVSLCIGKPLLCAT